MLALLRFSFSSSMSKAKKAAAAAGDKRGSAKGKLEKKKQVEKKSRGPKSHLEPNKRKVDHDIIQGATEMLDQSSEEQVIENGNSGNAGNSADFLLSLDERSVSK